MSRNETTLHARWSKRERDLVFHHPAHKEDGHLLYGTLCVGRWLPDWEEMRVAGKLSASFVKELEARGYDITTLKFSVKYKSDAPPMRRLFQRKARAWFGGQT